ncbi:DNA repair protein RadC (plasmid) [Streptococcus ruminicola]|uniref:DNA repair protein RadC n=1 Tax=Streptococcus ruminicola TaxID=2686210 RepID=A0A6G8I2Z0_9STRE|nr:MULTISPECIES: DNA repair protein RadC [Streptococcus]QGX47388.1 DNA repair protein RadC [Streptococcus equinus]QIM47436.1 DNA repair protein RadC [Streptococcus ruminicola]
METSYTITNNHEKSLNVCETVLNTEYTVDALSETELLAAFLQMSESDQEAFNKARNILDRVEVSRINSLGYGSLVKDYGLSEQQATSFLSALELFKRSSKANSTTQRIMSSERIANQLMIEIGDKKQEHLMVLYLDTQNRVIDKRIVFIGSVNRSIATPREILYYACQNMATSIIVAHNHPSGSINPSENDNIFTQKLEKACGTIEVTLLDHIIVTFNNYTSYREEGLL